MYVLASLFLPIESWARKTRSDKGGHHHHSAEYYAKKALTQDDTRETPSDSLAGSNAVANGSNAQVGDSELIANETLIFSIFTILSISTFIIGRVVSKRRNLLQIKQNEEEIFQWFSKVEQLKQNARISKGHATVHPGCQRGGSHGSVHFESTPCPRHGWTYRIQYDITFAICLRGMES